MTKIYASIFCVFLVGVFFAQNANVSYQVRLNSLFSSDGSWSSSSSCWEASNEEYSALISVFNPTAGLQYCLLDPGAGASSTYGGGNILQSLTNVAATSYIVNYDMWEDDGGSPCLYNAGDDCRAVGSYNIPFVNNYYPSANASYNNVTDNQVYNSGSSEHRIRLGTSWRYSGNASLITPTCAVQTAPYASGGIRSWSVNLIAGVTYNFNNCTSANSDTYMRIYGTDGFTIVATGDDNCGALSSINFTPTTTGTYYVELSSFSRGSLTLAGTLTYNIVSKVGSSMSNPIAIGTLACATNYSNTQNNTLNTGFCNDYGQASDDIYYSFVLASPATVNISHCGSGFDTYLQLLNSGGVLSNSNDDNGVLCAGTAGSLQIGLAAGTYYIVSEGYGANSGNIITNVSIAAANNPGTISAPAAICIGSTASISNVTTAIGASASDVASYYFYYQRTSAPTTGWVMYDGPSSATSSALPVAVTGTAGTYLLARNSAFPCFGQVSAPFLNLTVDAQPTLGTVSNAGPINFCDAGGNFTTAVNVSGQVGSIMWDWGSNNSVWNINWIAGSTSGICCFPIKTSNSDGNADRMRYRVSNGTCTAVTSSTILINNRYNPAPTSVSSSLPIFCSNSAPANITLTATFPQNINMNGTVRFYSGSCGGTLVGAVSPNALSPNASLTFAAPTNSTVYFARYEPGVGTGCANTACVQVTVTVNTPSVAPTSITGTSTICNGGSTTLTLSGGTAGTGATANWYTGSCGGTFVGTGNSIVVSPTSNTTYFVRYEGTCNTTTCAQVNVTVNVPSVSPTSITGTSTICNGGSTTLTLSGGSAGTGATANWYSGSCGGTLVGTGNSVTVSPTSNTTYFVRYEGTCNTTSCAQVNVIVNIPSVAPTSITGTSTICNGGSTTLTLSVGTAGTGATANWYTGSCGGTLVGTGNSVTVSPTSNTTYFVRYEGTCNTTTCAQVNVTVNTLSVSPTSITGTSTICNGGSTTLTLSGGTAGTGATANWYSGSCGATLVGTGNSITVSPTSNTTYFVRYEGICNTTTCAQVNVTVNTNSTAPTSIVNSGVTICHGNEVTLSASGGTLISGANYEWFSGSCGGTLLGTGSSINVAPTATTNYFVRVAINGICPATTCATGTITLPIAGTAISNNGESATCLVNGNNYIHFYHSSGRLIGSINPNGNNLGNVLMISYVDAAPQLVLACESSSLSLATSVMQRHWVISPTIQPSSSTFARLPYNNLELNTLMINANGNSNPTDDLSGAGNLKLSKYSGPSNVNAIASDNCAFPVSSGSGNTTLHNQSGAGGLTAANGFVNTIINSGYIQFDIGSFSEFWLHGAAIPSPLPIELKEFTVACDAETKIRWTTASENNTEKFIIEKSRDLVMWDFVGEQSAAGNSSVEIAYEFIDFNSWNGISYYRMKQVDLNGLEKIYGPISLDCESNGFNSIFVFPNPAKSEFTIKIEVDNEVTGEIKMTDMTGKLIFSKDATLSHGVNHFEINDQKLEKGTYFIHFESSINRLNPVKLIIID